MKKTMTVKETQDAMMRCMNKVSFIRYTADALRQSTIENFDVQDFGCGLMVVTNDIITDLVGIIEFMPKGAEATTPQDEKTPSK